MDKNKEIIKNEVGEDATKYGEFVSSYFAWISLPNQKERTEELANMTKNKEKGRNNKKNNQKQLKILPKR